MKWGHRFGARWGYEGTPILGLLQVELGTPISGPQFVTPDFECHFSE
jgi:hypothetical protein